MKIATVVVLYNPDPNFLEHFADYSVFSEAVYLVDNSDKTPSPETIEKLKAIPKSVYISLNGNKGIGEALRVGTEEAIKIGADYVLTMDQDSSFPMEKLDKIMDILEKCKDSEYGVIGVNYFDGGMTEELVPILSLISSGSFISIEKYKELPIGFDPKLFIDMVDVYLCYEMYKAGYKTAYVDGITIHHTMGNPTYPRGLFKKHYTENYSAVRHYTRFRNSYYLYHYVDKYFFHENYHYFFHKVWIKILLWEKDKWKKMKAIRRAKRDAKKGIFGPCPYPDLY